MAAHGPGAVEQNGALRRQPQWLLAEMSGPDGNIYWRKFITIAPRVERTETMFEYNGCRCRAYPLWRGVQAVRERQQSFGLAQLESQLREGRR